MSRADSLNQSCRCITVDAARLRAALESRPTTAGLYASIRDNQPNLFSAAAVFVAPDDVAQMRAVIRAVGSVVALPAYVEGVLGDAGIPPAYRPDRGPRGVFLGFDFHLGPRGPQLIEVNTNSGGALLNAALAAAQLACCPEVERLVAEPGEGESTETTGDGNDGASSNTCAGGPAGSHALAQPDRAEATILAMFREEWRLQRGEAPLRRIAIVDEDPQSQYLRPEFDLFASLFESAGIAAMVVDPRSLTWNGVCLQHEDRTVDLVYNRLTDFAFTDPASAALRAAYEAGGAVVTPHPRAHALWADKRNLAIFSDAAVLRELGAAPETIDILAAGVPHTKQVDPSRADAWWAERKRWFFKPVDGYGGKAAYRGDKLTRGVFASILEGRYVAQEIVPPSERTIELDGASVPLKLDLRNYVYADRVQLVAARLYQGQTTNFRTPGGGFAPVFTTRP